MPELGHFLKENIVDISWIKKCLSIITTSATFALIARHILLFKH